MAAQNRSEAVPNFRPNMGGGGRGAVEADTPVSYRPSLDTPPPSSGGGTISAQISCFITDPAFPLLASVPLP